MIVLFTRHIKTIKLNRELAKHNEEKRTLISIMAHDLRNPFSNFLGYTDLLHYDYDGLEPVARENIIKEINISAHRYFDLLENLLTWIKTQSTYHKLDISKVNLFSSINKILHVYEPMILHKNIKVTVKIDPDLLIDSDENILMSIIRNLLNNSIKFTNPGGNIKISFEEAAGKEEL